MTLLLVAALLLAAAAPSFLSVFAEPRKLPVYSVQRDDRCVSLTFDAAWGNEDTQLLIDILDRYGVKVTFFVVGFWAEKYPESVKALHDAGHEVMTHSDDHAHFNSLSPAQMSANLQAGCEKIEAVTGVRPTLFRAPYGEYNDAVVQTAADNGLSTIQWSVEAMAAASRH
ncbi:MAG: polysaccharide deacetylase family protein [Oscillospiraceae bacterium]|nr:polysaccharide deacetylase family protein [Oscillospiraceae bacterium]